MWLTVGLLSLPLVLNENAAGIGSLTVEPDMSLSWMINAKVSDAVFEFLPTVMGGQLLLSANELTMSIATHTHNDEDIHPAVT